jgi:hypothetical protein
MKEDILEQLVDNYFLRQPATFTKHNVKFKPDSVDIDHLGNSDKSKYSVPSDIDVLAVHLNEKGGKEVSAISCKSWQSGFDIDFFYEHLIDEEKRKVRVGTSELWKKFRELVEPNWSKAFRDTIYKETNTYNFTYYIAVTKIKKNKDTKIEDFMNCPLFLKNLSNNNKSTVKIKFLTLKEMFQKIFDEKSNTTIESTEIGRLIQLMKAANIKMGAQT